MIEAVWQLQDFLDSGGWVLWGILLVTIVLWTLMLERLWFLGRVFPRQAKDYQQAGARGAPQFGCAAYPQCLVVAGAAAIDSVLADGAGTDRTLSLARFARYR